MGYHDARVLYNTMIDLRPPAIVRVADHSDVSSVLRYARERGLPVSVRGGGHGMVTAAERPVVAGAAAGPELFWALRGGGGDSGVVVSGEGVERCS